MIKFEWDPAKAETNVKQHDVTFEEARSVFFDDYARQFFDDEHARKAKPDVRTYYEEPQP